MDTVFPRHEQALELTSTPTDSFWQLVFVKHPSRLRFIFDSYASHVLFVLIIYGLSTSPLFHRRPQSTLDPYADTHIEYYPVSRYLPPVAAPPKPQKHALQGQPALAKQEIISVPPEPDNSRQTVITPNLRVLHKEIPLPNIVAWDDRVAPIQPLSASADLSKPKLLLPPDVVAPAPDELPATQRRIVEKIDVIKPPVDLNDAKMRLPSQLTPSVVEPPPSAASIERKAGSINLAKLGPEVAAPKLPTPEQRSAGAPGGSAAAPVPPPAASVQSIGNSKTHGRMLALSIQPHEVHGPIEPPEGSRKGVFAASPTGKEGAPGTPTIPGGGSVENGSPGSSTAATTASHRLEGIYVGPAPAAPAASPSGPDSSTRAKLLGAMRSAMADISRKPPEAAPPPSRDTQIERRVFGDKKFYSMVLNMPNLTSSVGSWIVRYAELQPSPDKSELSAPVALNKVDPAYPSELIRDRVEGTVVLYAVIRVDGSVDGIRVLQGVDQHLDQNAIRAFSRWRFRPGTKHGVPVDIEAVIQVPFRISKWNQ
ncbi:MAG TPA: TonB family protein [Terriglobales bacterium]